MLPPAAALRDLPAFSSPAASVPITPLSTALSVPSLTIPTPTRATGMDTGLPAWTQGYLCQVCLGCPCQPKSSQRYWPLNSSTWPRWFREIGVHRTTTSRSVATAQGACNRHLGMCGMFFIHGHCTTVSTKHPDKTSQFMAYQRTIVKAHRSFAGEGWLIYDTCFCRKAALTKSLEWGRWTSPCIMKHLLGEPGQCVVVHPAAVSII